jgi:signal transduction histidine kinase
MRRPRWARLRKWRHSIGWRVVVLFVVLALAIALVFLAGTQRLLRAAWQGYAQPLVADYVDRLATEIGSPPNMARAAALAARLPVTITIEGPAVRWQSHPQRDARHRHDDDEDAGSGNLRRRSADGHVIEFGLASLPPAARPRFIGWATLALLLVFTGVAYAVVRRWLRPLQAIGAGAERFGRGEFEPPIVVQRQDELGELAGRINVMAASLRERLEAQRALLLAISHELRSPLTRARLNAELVPDGPEREALLHDLAEMGDLVTDLLESERLARGAVALQTEAIDLNALVREVVAGLPGGAAVRLDLDPALGPQSLDPARMRLLVRNLVGNALRHAADAPEPPVVSTHQPGPHSPTLELSVRDFGPGVDEAQLAKLGEAFWRPDAARTRAAGGVGLGLFLCRRVAQAHGGQLRFADAGPGLRATLHLPSLRLP